MLAKILALILHEVMEEYAQLCDDEGASEPPDAHIKIGFSTGRKPDDG
jgi:hypothetical protein